MDVTVGLCSHEAIASSSIIPIEFSLRFKKRLCTQ